MSIKISEHPFEGPHPCSGNFLRRLRRSPGVYVILGLNHGNRWEVIDVGESRDIRNRIVSHERGACWRAQNLANLSVAVLYTDRSPYRYNEHRRMRLEARIRREYNPPCGFR